MTEKLWQYLIAPRQLPSPEDRYSGLLLLLLVLLYFFILVMWVLEHRTDALVWFPPALGIWLIGIHRLFWISRPPQTNITQARSTRRDHPSRYIKFSPVLDGHDFPSKYAPIPHRKLPRGVAPLFPFLSLSDGLVASGYSLDDLG